MRESLKKIVIAVLTFEAKLILKRYRPKIVAVTGSVGKTSAKDAAATVLASKFRVRKSQKSYNSEFGVPLTIIGAETGWNSPLKWARAIAKGAGLIIKKVPYPEILVLEVGADRPGDIRKIRAWVEPDVAVVTALQPTPVHVEFFESPEALFHEKSELVHGLKAKAKVILNADDEEVMKMKGHTEAEITTFGFSKSAGVSSIKYQIILRKERGKPSVPEGIKFDLKYQGAALPVKISGTLGRHQVYAALAGAAAGFAFEMKTEEIAEALSLYRSPPGRLTIIKGIKDTILLDDSYNSSPKALAAALEVLSEVPATRKIAVLGDMLELGKYTIVAHRQIGESLPGKIDLLFTVGVRSKFFAEGAVNSGFDKKNIKSFEDAESAGRELQNIMEPGDAILVKGSQSIRLEKVVEEVMADPQRKEELLCRQDKEWKKI